MLFIQKVSGLIGEKEGKKADLSHSRMGSGSTWDVCSSGIHSGNKVRINSGDDSFNIVIACLYIRDIVFF